MTAMAHVSSVMKCTVYEGAGKWKVECCTQRLLVRLTVVLKHYILVSLQMAGDAGVMDDGHCAFHVSVINCRCKRVSSVGVVEEVIKWRCGRQ